MSCKPLVSQKTVTWKKETKSFTNKNSQPSCAPLPSMHSTTEAEKSKLALNHQQGKLLLSLERFISTQEATIRMEDSEYPCCPWKENRADLLYHSHVQPAGFPWAHLCLEKLARSLDMSPSLLCTHLSSKAHLPLTMCPATPAKPLCFIYATSSTARQCINRNMKYQVKPGNHI